MSDKNIKDLIEVYLAIMSDKYNCKIKLKSILPIQDAQV